MAVDHKSIADIDLHEPKGVASASNNYVYVSNGSGSGTWKVAGTRVEQGFWNYSDVSTTTTPIPLTVASTQYELTNDGLGTETNKTYKISSIADIWNSTTNRLDFSGLSLGDTVDIRVDLSWTTSSANSEITLAIELGVGGTPRQIPIISDKEFKNSGVHSVAEFNGIYLGDTNTLNNPARFLAKCDSVGSTVTVNGFYVRVLRNGA